MIPNNALSSQAINSPFIVPDRLDELLDYEYGGIALGDVSQGLQAKLWSCFYENGQIKASNDLTTQVLLAVENVTALSLAFDFNMRPMVAYLANGHCYLWWYDSQAAVQITTDFGPSLSFPQLALDDKRSSQSANADVIFAYIKNNKAYMRIQRERFQIEHEITPAKRLIQIGMMTNYRFGFAYYDWD